ncbi:UxaA family hydrolase [Parahaliea aestuarii]|uniref:Altronate dehydratase n=1 Tax=Parahaliea aestuarii TaxID=1852021 RepID=A0A5C8ZVV9_9GAMM|nr:altronate dehydratase family protein [Parahaliea aestuarii]TXS91722.1 altronate dehydratase [Parahaliea aestuarii]
MNLIRINAADNVAIAVNDIPAGALLGVAGASMESRAAIPAMHKVAITAIAGGQPILKYGQVIGFAAADIAPGDHVHVHNCRMGELEKDYGFCRHAVSPALVPAAAQARFMGYLRADGRAGTRNFLGVLTSVNCSATVARGIAARGEALLADYPGIDGVVALAHSSGCGMQGDDEGYLTLRRTLEGYARHPNFAGVMLVGLGCETLQIQRVMEESGLADSGRFRAFTIQDAGGTRAAIERGVSVLKEMLPAANACRREPIPASELVLAVQCGGSDALSGLTANPALGEAGDWLIRHGGSVIYSETPEIYGAEHLLTQRAQTPQIAEALLERIRWWEDYTRINGVELDSNPSPGNKAGGLTTILEKSLGAQAKSGSTPMTGVYRYAEPVTRKGLAFMDSPGYDPVSVTGQVASGANVICFTTGRGSAFGFKPVPCLKLASNQRLFDRMGEDMDINCGDIVSGDSDVQRKGEEIFERVLAVASGERTASELLGYGDNEFNPWKIGATV